MMSLGLPSWLRAWSRPVVASPSPAAAGFRLRLIERNRVMTRRKPTEGRVRRVLACGALAAVLMTSAAEAVSGHKIIGVGLGSCGKWTSDAREYGDGRPVIPGSQAHLAQTQWALGYLSGVGLATDAFDPLNNVDAQGVWAWIDNYCQAHTERIADAAKAFVDAPPH